MKEYLHALMELESISRDHHNFVKNPNCDWSSFKALEKVFLAHNPTHKSEYERFMMEEERKWGSNFSEAFKKHSLATFFGKTLT